MKTIILAFTTIAVFIGCKSNNKTSLDTNKNMVLVDTMGLYKGSVLTDTGYINPSALVNDPNSGVTSFTKSTTTTTTTVTTTTGNGDIQPVAAKRHTNQTTNRRTAPVARRSNRSATNNSTAGTQAATPKRDKGWSDAAKGTAIGAGSGAVIGAIVSKNKVKGAVIGGILGGGAGYAIGRSRDKKSGRVDRNRRANYIY